ncbi:hypothetical protein RISK_006546 [Rhodopirellula islandica]|uniref:Uncharacterized protein n=1 Tax=Rhodopirellula islandica TaxID=595434 RepID=A0A0J1B3I5_RHOIS|nr:hypothetical protein RISK_006546 [Rhodopirellula islandica]
MASVPYPLESNHDMKAIGFIEFCHSLLRHVPQHSWRLK